MSVADGLNKVKLFYGEIAILSIQQLGGAADVEVVVDPDDMPEDGDYVYITDNTNAPDGYYLVTGLVDDSTFTIDYQGGTGTVTGGELSLGKEFTVYHSDNENIKIVRKPKKRLDKVILENIIGYQTVLNIDFEPWTESERLFMYQFAKNDMQRAEIFSTLYTDVLLENPELITEMIEGIYFATNVSIQLVERSVTLASVGAYTPGTTSSNGYYSSSPDGTRIKLTMNWGAGDISRNFTVNLADPYSAQLERKDFQFLDDSLGRSNFGFRQMFRIDFGTFGFSDTPTTINADLAWIKTFILAPSKSIDVSNVYQAQVVNDFEELNVGYLAGFVFAKTLELNFISRSLQENPTPSTGIFTLDDNTYGLLDGIGVLQ